MDGVAKQIRDKISSGATTSHCGEGALGHSPPDRTAGSVSDLTPTVHPDNTVSWTRPGALPLLSPAAFQLCSNSYSLSLSHLRLLSAKGGQLDSIRFIFLLYSLPAHQPFRFKMADEGAPAPKKKKLPFKPTALRRAPKPVPKEDNKESDDDGLDLFRRSKEMAPIMAADRERRMRRKQKHEEERRRSITSEKRPHDDLEEDEAPVQSSVQSSVQRSMSRETSHLEESQPAVDESMTVVGDSFRYGFFHSQREPCLTAV